ncbi:MAG: type II CAAX endopeptidase family protein [Fimbriimonadales bacterium]
MEEHHEAAEVLEPQGQRPHEAGFPGVWVILFVMFAGLAYLSISSIVNPPGLSDDQRWLYEFSQKYDRKYEAAHTESAKKTVLESARTELESAKLKTDGSKGSRERYLLILSRELGEQGPLPVLNSKTDDIADDADRESAKKTRDGLNKALLSLYEGKAKTPEEQRKLRVEIMKNSSGRFPFSIALDKAGAQRKTETPSALMSLFAIVALGGFIAGVSLLFVFISNVANRKWTFTGFPLAGASPAVADELGLKMVAYLLVFSLLGGALASMLSGFLPDSWADVAGSTILVVVLFSIARSRWISQFPGLRGLGIRRENIGRQIGMGFAAFLMAIPIVFGVGMLSNFLFPGLPSADHPVSRELLESSNVLPAILSASVFAPLTEELFFRACLFQGLALRLKRPAVALVLSSLMFASIHPQGAASWLPLMAVGAVAGLTFWHTGSVLSAMVMHGLWNLSIIGISLVVQ